MDDTNINRRTEIHQETMCNLIEYIKSLPKEKNLLFVVDNDPDNAFIAAYNASINGIDPSCIVVISTTTLNSSGFNFVDIDSIDLENLGEAAKAYEGRSIFMLDWELGANRPDGLKISGQLKRKKIPDQNVMFYSTDYRLPTLFEEEVDRARFIRKPIEEVELPKIRKFLTGEA